MCITFTTIAETAIADMTRPDRECPQHRARERRIVVPECQTAPRPNAFRPVVEFRGRCLHSSPSFYGPLASLLISEPTAVCVGIARAGSTSTSRTSWRSTSGPCRRSVPSCRCSSGCWERRRRASTPQKGRLHQVGQIIRLASKAVEATFRTNGASAWKKGRRIERYFRDLNMIRTDLTLQCERTWENVGSMRLGLQPEMPI
jgi:hypothetical protein